ncbi:polysaccharide pyruvyl transferase family protein [Aquibaculum sediminis]|uniref:polysaccharide pyruvyl transferase family protein n=1 Tax=Aquibaculum sediminis TaxID=3231907 RepID=UPI0034523A35
MIKTIECVPLHYWDLRVNFGDLLAPWLVERMTGRPVTFIKENRSCVHYVVVGSILGHVRSTSIVWGVGSFGTEQKERVEKRAKYLAVRGPLTRNKILTAGGHCPDIYGDPGLLVPLFYQPEIEKKHDVGVIIRHSEQKWRKSLSKTNIKVIDLNTDAIEDTVKDICSCKRIVSSSLHGLILADAYGIPNAWLESESPWGGTFKYWDYLISVDKVKHPVRFDMGAADLTSADIVSAVSFDGRKIKLDLNALIDANPFGWNPSADIRSIISLR